MPVDPTPAEQAELDKIEAALAKLAKQAAPLKARKAVILARIRQRDFHTRQKASDQS